MSKQARGGIWVKSGPTSYRKFGIWADSPLYYCLGCRSLFPYITIPELLVLPQHQLRADMLGGG